jgi:membrane protease YdiL (CAAX protease family)
MATSAQTAYNGLERAPMDILNAVKTFGFLFTVTLLQWYCFINAPAEGFNKDVAMVYMQMSTTFLVIVVLVTSITKMQIKTLKTVKILFNGMAGFWVAWAFVLVFYGQIMGVTFGTVPASQIWGIILTQVLFVAVVEEMVFRWLIPTYLQSVFSRHYRWLALLLPQVSFALFHVGVYQGDWNALVIAFLFGCVMMLAFEYVPKFGKNKSGEPREKLGLGFVIGCHAAFNLVLIGVLAPGGITMLIGG